MIPKILKGQTAKKLHKQPNHAILKEAKMLSEELLSRDVSHIDVSEAKRKIRARVAAAQAIKFK